MRLPSQFPFRDHPFINGWFWALTATFAGVIIGRML